MRRKIGGVTWKCLKNERFRNFRGLVVHLGERLKKGEGCGQMILIPPEIDTSVEFTRAA
jgi:hypothetical protein